MAKLAKADYPIIEKTFVLVVAKETQLRKTMFCSQREGIGKPLGFLANS